MCHIFICYDYIKDDTTAKAKDNIHTGRLNSVRAFSLPLAPAATGAISDFSLESLSRCAQRKPAGSSERGFCFVMLDGPKTSGDQRRQRDY